MRAETNVVTVFFLTMLTMGMKYW